ncbi:kinase-like protein [Rhizoclosmatium globosum]|uniref:Kinase-like protein n=1 Tax=Rhizoclosmatium globosum TaxID=329046 RepID=A0A1Y2CWZ5_9FUNG|nr:kinase-like protein [Rhizoclosmatium globosum]|eukprot:ORY51553.1 kinase-like protein [Rhizoclosmatium globosum]
MNFKLHTFNGVQYALPEPLTPVKVLGSGTFGLVIRATSPHYETPVAIKIIRDTLGTAKEKANAFREIDILKTVRHQNIILIQDSFIFGQNVYIQTESLDSDLKMVLDSELIISEPNMLKMMKQIVSAVAYLHGICIMNRDLKPANILVDISTFHVKLCDFGSARLFPMRSRPNSPLATSPPHPVPCFPDELLEIPFDDAFSLKVPTSELILPKPVLEPFPSELTREIETLWYRAPEILFGERMYTVSVDLWALGCVLVEIALRKPLFAGDTDQEQMTLILHAFKLNYLPQTDWDFLSSYFRNACRTDLNDVLVGKGLKMRMGIDFLDVVLRFLQFIPSERLSAVNALEFRLFRHE